MVVGECGASCDADSEILGFKIRVSDKYRVAEELGRWRSYGDVLGELIDLINFERNAVRD